MEKVKTKSALKREARNKAIRDYVNSLSGSKSEIKTLAAKKFGLTINTIYTVLRANGA